MNNLGRMCCCGLGSEAAQVPAAAAWESRLLGCAGLAAGLGRAGAGTAEHSLAWESGHRARRGGLAGLAPPRRAGLAQSQESRVRRAGLAPPSTAGLAKPRTLGETQDRPSTVLLLASQAPQLGQAEQRRPDPAQFCFASTASTLGQLSRPAQMRTGSQMSRPAQISTA